MGIISGITNSLKSELGTEQLKTQASGLGKMAGDVLSIPKGPKATETFEEALARLHLSEADIERRKIQFQRLARIYLALGAIVFLYMFYLIFEKAFFPTLGCLGLLLILFSQFFRYSFWLFQMRERRLGCTFSEWLSEWMGKKR
jgi:intracellular multiplication protein IcmV